MAIDWLIDRKILITGGSGFIGTNLIDALCELTQSIVNFSRGTPQKPQQQKYYVHGDVLDADAVTGMVKEFSPDVIIHLAAKTRYGNREDREGYRINTEGTMHVLEAARGTASVRRVIVASSNVVGHDHPQGEYTYANSKRLAESFAHAKSDSQMRWCIVRPCSVWGPWFDAPFKECFLAIARGRYVHPGPLKSMRHIGYVGNVVFQILQLLRAPQQVFHGQTYYLADYDPVQLRTWLDTVSIRLEKRPPMVIPKTLAHMSACCGDVFSALGWKHLPLTTERLRNMETNQRDIPIGKTEAVVGTLPYTTMEGIDITLRWMRDQHLF